MKIAVLGATGFIGRALVARLQRDQHHVVAISRDSTRARGMLGHDVEHVALHDLERAIRGADAVVNLAGGNILARRWSDRRKRDLRESRVGLTRRLVEAIGAERARPRVLISASAVGYYGDSGTRVVDEMTPVGTGFLAALCRDWEEEATRAQALGVRVAIPRFGVVLGPEGGAWPALERALASGFGGALGSGEQIVPWVHLEDAVEAVVAMLESEGWRGAFNVAAPSPLDQAELSRVVGRRLGRSLGPRVPGGFLRLVLGERAEALLSSQRAEPRALLQRGFAFRFPELPAAVDALRGLTESVRITPAGAEAANAAGWGRATHSLTQVTELGAGVDEVFEYFSRAQNLGPMTPAWAQFRILGAPPTRVHDGLTIDYRLSLLRLPVRWRTSIARWEPGRRFVDVQARGPYRLWWHEHRFEGSGEQTRMVDTVHYALPLGPIGRVVHRFVVAPTLRRIFGFRRAAIAFRFGLRRVAGRSAA